MACTSTCNRERLATGASSIVNFLGQQLRVQSWPREPLHQVMLWLHVQLAFPCKRQSAKIQKKNYKTILCDFCPPNCLIVSTAMRCSRNKAHCVERLLVKEAKNVHDAFLGHIKEREVLFCRHFKDAADEQEGTVIRGLETTETRKEQALVLISSVDAMCMTRTAKLSKSVRTTLHDVSSRSKIA